MVYALHEDSSGVSQRGPLRDLAGAFLAPSAPYRIEYFDPVHMVYGVASFTSSASGIPTAPPTMNLVNISQMRDSDSDGLPDVAEGVLGTNPLLRDSDADGLSDLAEIQQGTDPLSGRAFPSGVIARPPASTKPP